METVPIRRAGEQLELIDTLAEYVQTLGGVAIAEMRHVAEVTSIERARRGRRSTGDARAATLRARGDHHGGARGD